jgi:hypothetical protein
MDLKDIVICDVGAHKMWMSRMFRCEHPNTCIISNGLRAWESPYRVPLPRNSPTLNKR